MTTDLISLALIALIAAFAPLVASRIPGKPIPETVFLLLIGALLGPFMAGLVQVSDSVSLLADLGLAFLFLLAGYEINPKNLTGSQGKRGLATWVISLVIAFIVIRFIPDLQENRIEGIAIAIAMTTTALGTLLPILKERGLFGTRIGDSILAYGTWGELCPVIAMALLLSTRAEWKTVLILLAFVAVAVLAGVFSSRAKKAGGKLFHFLTENSETTAQTAMRFTVLLLVSLVALSSIFNLDIVLGAFAAGFVLRYVIPDGDSRLEAKLDGIAYGFFIPLFFVVSGAKINLAAVFTQPALLIGFILVLFLVRAMPILIALSTGKDTRDMSSNSKLTIALYCTTALPIIVAVTTVAVQAGAMDQETASVLVSAGAITVFLMPFLASITYRVVDAQPLDAVKEIAQNPRDISSIIRDHIALERMLSKQGGIMKAATYGKGYADKTWQSLKAAGDDRWEAIKKAGDDALLAQPDQSWIEEAASMQERAELREKAEEARDQLAQRAAAAEAAHSEEVAARFAKERLKRIEAMKRAGHSSRPVPPDPSEDKNASS